MPKNRIEKLNKISDPSRLIEGNLFSILLPFFVNMQKLDLSGERQSPTSNKILLTLDKTDSIEFNPLSIDEVSEKMTMSSAYCKILHLVALIESNSAVYMSYNMGLNTFP